MIQINERYGRGVSQFTPREALLQKYTNYLMLSPASNIFIDKSYKIYYHLSAITQPVA